MIETDEQLVRAYLDGDETLFAALVDRYMKHLYNFVLQLVGNQNAAEDIVQDTFVKVWKHLRTFRPGQEFQNLDFRHSQKHRLRLSEKEEVTSFFAFSKRRGEKYPGKYFGWQPESGRDA